MGPPLFEPYATHVAERVRLLRPSRILETAAGTGIVTRAVAAAIPEAEIVATDINPALVEFAAQNFPSRRVRFERADAQDLPYEDESFDLVLCLFGLMFFPDKQRANAEARRVLRGGGRYVVVTFDRLDRNPIPRAAGEAVATLFPEDPRYMERGPFSYADATVVESDLRAAGFENVVVETVELSSRVTAHEAAKGIVLGSPFRAEIERLDASALERATGAVREALLPWDGKDAPMAAHLATATRKLRSPLSRTRRLAELAARSHPGRTAPQNAAMSGDPQGKGSRTARPKAAWVGPLLTFMVPAVLGERRFVASENSLQIRQLHHAPHADPVAR